MRYLTGEIPPNVLKLMEPADRAGLGELGLLPAEVNQRADAKVEKQLQKDICQWLNLRGLVFLQFRMDKATGATIGWPDITVIVEGAPIFMECKTDTGTLSTDQRRVCKALVAQGGRVFIVRSFQRAQQIVGAALAMLDIPDDRAQL